MRNDLHTWRFLDGDVWNACLDRALDWYHASERWVDVAAGRSIGLVFLNPSLRTRTSMELAAGQLGAFSSTLNAQQGLWGFEWQTGAVMDGAAAEHISEAVGVLSRYYDALGVRCFASMQDYEADRQDQYMKAIQAASSVPVVNLESAFYHPCQALADAATIRSRLNGNVKGRRFLLTWAYHPRALPMAVPNSALLMAARSGMHVTVAHPEGFDLDEDVIRAAKDLAAPNEGSVEVSHDPDGAFDGADIVYAKAWGGRALYEDSDREQVQREAMKGWRVTVDRMARTNQGGFMHCLPVRRNVVVDDAVLDSRSSIHLLQAEMRLHAQKAILEWIWDLPGMPSGASRA